MRYHVRVLFLLLSLHRIPAPVKSMSIPLPHYCRQEKFQDSQSMLWVVRRDPPAYFFGTIHVPYTEVWQYISAEAKSAFKDSQNIIFELDLSNSYTLRTLTRCQLLPEKERLRHHLPRDIYQRLRNHMEYIRESLPLWLYPGGSRRKDELFQKVAGNWERKRPVWLLLMLNWLTEEDIKQKGVPVLDLYLAQEAQLQAKDVGAIEKAQEQCTPLNSLNSSQVIFALNHTLRRHEYLRSHKEDAATSPRRANTRDLIEHYNCGSLDDSVFNRDSMQVPTVPGGDSETHERAKAIDSYFRRELIHKRNIRMADRVRHLLDENPRQSFFFAFGAGHFLGKDSVIELVRQTGYAIEPVLHKRHQDRRKQKPISSNENFGWMNSRWSQYHRRLQRPSVDHHQKLQQKPQADRPKFQDLWVRIENFTPKPWQEIEYGVGATVMRSRNEKRLRYGQNLKQNSGKTAACTLSLTMLLILIYSEVKFLY